MIDKFLDNSKSCFGCLGPLGMPLHSEVEAALRIDDSLEDAVVRTCDDFESVCIGERLMVPRLHEA